MTVRTWSSRAAANNSVSASAPNNLPMPDSTTCLMISAPGEPPGSRVTIARILATFRRSASILICVGFPAPPAPSKVMNRPRPGVRLTAASTISEFLGAQAERTDDEFACTIDRPAHRRSHADGFSRINRRLHGDIASAPNPHDTDLLAGLHRRAHWSAIDQARDQLVDAVLVNHRLDRFGANQFDRAAFAAKHLCVANRLPGREQCPRFEVAKSPFEHFLGFGRTIVGVLQAVDYHDQPYAILHGGADHAVTALLGIPGL